EARTLAEEGDEGDALHLSPARADAVDQQRHGARSACGHQDEREDVVVRYPCGVRAQRRKDLLRITVRGKDDVSQRAIFLKQGYFSTLDKAVDAVAQSRKGDVDELLVSVARKREGNDPGFGRIRRHHAEPEAKQGPANASAQVPPHRCSPRSI